MRGMQTWEAEESAGAPCVFRGGAAWSNDQEVEATLKHCLRLVPGRYQEKLGAGYRQ